MRYIVAIFSGFLMFILTFVLFGFLAALWLPQSFIETPINLGFFTGNMGGLIAWIIASLFAGASFRATLKRYKRKDREKAPPIPSQPEQ